VNRWKDWWEQAERDLRHGGNSLAAEDHEWAAFAAHQAAEKAIKALIYALGGEPWGHSILGLLRSLPEDEGVPDPVEQAGSRLDKHYLPSRYPNGLPAGFPGELYTAGEARSALHDAQQVLEFCRGRLPGP
jgi:HEPN domain-containing protein